MKCTINDIANVISESIPNPAESGYDIFVGLEHYDSGEVKVTRYGSTDSLVTAVKVFKKGDILLARRNVYLKRAGLVDFDGVTSGDSIVLRVKSDLSQLGISSTSVQRYLPFVLNTDEFWNYAEKYSDGTMSKRLSPKTLLQYEFDIPEDVDSRNELLWAAFETKESYRAMIKATDEMVKSQFIEMFGDPINNSKHWDLIPLASLGRLERGVSKARPRNAPDLLGGPYPLVQTGEVANCETYITSYNSTYSEKGLAQSKMWPAGTLCITIAANIAKTGILTFDACFPDSVVGFIPNDSVDLIFVHHWFRAVQQHLEELAPSTAQKNMNLAVLSSLTVISPPLIEQQLFSSIVNQADKSKFDGFKSQFIEMFGQASDKESKYPVRKLSECCSYISDGSHFSPEGKTNGRYPMLSVKDMTEVGFTYSDCKFIDEKDYRFLVKNGCKPLLGDVLVAKDGSYFKFSFTLEEEKEQAILSSIAILRPIEAVVLSRYLAYYMLTDAVIQLVEDNYLTGTAIRRVILKGFKEIPVIVPPIDSQERFVGILNNTDKSKFELKLAIDKIDKVMRALMQ